MDVKTKQGTVVSVDNQHIFNFPEGLFGFASWIEPTVSLSSFWSQRRWSEGF